MKTLAVVPARAGSRGVPGKNKRDFCGKPLVSWAIEVGRATCDRVVVTSDDSDVLCIARGKAAETLERPAGLALDETPMIDVLQHVLACQPEPPEVVVLLQPTSPLRTADHVRRALAMWETTDGHSVVSVVPIPAHMSPDYACSLSDGRGWLWVPQLTKRRQDCRPTYYRDGTVYVMRADMLRGGEMYWHAVPLILGANESVTIDTEDDWARAEQMWRKQHGSV